MLNPLLNRANQQPKQQGNSLIQELTRLKSMGPSNVVFDKMYSENPDFRRFADTVRNMTPEQAFQQYGLDFGMFKDQKW